MDYFRIARPPLTFIGWGAIGQLISEVEQFDPEKILIIADPVLVQIGVVGRITENLLTGGYRFDLYTDIIPEPLLETGQKLVDFARAGNYSLIIGIGGGSALDLAKLAAAFITNNGTVAEYLNLSGSKIFTKAAIPKILIPTTSGTGAEVTNISVLALKHTKDVISHDFLIADIAIVDPQLTISVPSKVTAATGADALTHAIEAYISVNSNSYSDSLAIRAISLISAAIRQAVKDGSNKEARTDMAYGSYLAGLSFFNAGVGAIHALAYPLGGQFHIAHGDSNAVLIPYVLNYIQASCVFKLGKIFEAMGGDIKGMSPAEASVACINSLVSLLCDVGIPQTLGGFNIPESALEQLTTDGTKQTRLLARCPMALTARDISNIYQSAFTGKLSNNY
ncbi:MAG: iron-containing alcohol dehydrogenase [Phormidesmis sp. FL-bin-119]|nr:iron-containing alcohol dehydrogenase [Pedobacter sp.]